MKHGFHLLYTEVSPVCAEENLATRFGIKYVENFRHLKKVKFQLFMKFF